ncbi:MAG: CU044_2847 family protein [Leptolinea sp.]
MKRLIEFPLEDGGTILVEVDEFESEFGSVPVAREDEIVVKANQTFEHALETIQPVARTVVKKFRIMPDTPDEVQVAFGVKLSAEAGALIASTGVEANFTITLKWRKDTKKKGE